MLNPFQPFKDIDNRIFSTLLNVEFSKDLEITAFLVSIPEEERDDFANSQINNLRQKYLHKNPQYKYASAHLRTRYDEIEKEIMNILYN